MSVVMLEVFVVCTRNRNPFDNHNLNHNEGFKTLLLKFVFTTGTIWELFVITSGCQETTEILSFLPGSAVSGLLYCHSRS